METALSVASFSSASSRRSKRDALGRPILVVEDQRSLAEMLCAMLHERWGCRVDIAATMAQAAARIDEKHDYLVACCDLNLLDARNAEIIDLCAAAQLPTIAVSAAFGEEICKTMIQKGVVDYVLKNNLGAYAYVCDLVGRINRYLRTKALAVDAAPDSLAALCKH